MRRLFIVPAGLFVVMLIGFIIGFAGSVPFVLLLSIVCAAPMFLIAFGFAFGKASNRYTFFVPKEVIQQGPSPRVRRPAATYDVGAGDLRGN